MTKLLFLPHCLEKQVLKEIKTKGEEKGYNVYITGGSSKVKEIMSKYMEISKIVGVACKDELELAKKYTKYLKKKGVELVSIELESQGCKNTKVNIEKLLEALA